MLSFFVVMKSFNRKKIYIKNLNQTLCTLKQDAKYNKNHAVR